MDLQQFVGKYVELWDNNYHVFVVCKVDRVEGEKIFYGPHLTDYRFYNIADSWTFCNTTDSIIPARLEDTNRLNKKIQENS